MVRLLSAHVASYPVSPQGWFFTGAAGDPPHQNTVGYWLRKTLRDAGLSEIKLHDLRHFFASGLIAEGCDVVTVQRALGHSNRPRRSTPTRTCGRPPRTAPDGQHRASWTPSCRFLGTLCGLLPHRPRLTCTSARVHTLKRNLSRIN